MRGVTAEDERIALFLDYENLAIGARDGLRVSPFDFGPVADALAERGRVVARRAYADWSSFDEDRRLLARAQVELIEIPQRLGGSRKNAADIKMAVDAIEMAYERDFVTTFAIGTGDSDFSPLMLKLRELDKRVIGIGVQSSTSALLPAACDEFLYYDRLPGIEHRGRAAAAPSAATTASGDDEHDAEADVGTLIASTLAGLARRSDGPVRSSTLKRAVLRKDPTFDESDQGFRGFGELLTHLAGRRIIEVGPTGGTGDPEVTFPRDTTDEDGAFALLVEVVREAGTLQLSGLKDRLRKRRSDFSEKRYGFSSFLSFAKAARARDLVVMAWDDHLGDYTLRVPR